MLDSNETTRAAAAPTKSGVVPYDWGRLPKVSHRSVELINGVRRVFAGVAEGFDELDTLLESLTGMEHGVEPPSVEVREDEIAPEFGQGFVTQFFTPPGTEAGVLAIDRLLVDRWLESLWGEPNVVRRPKAIEPSDFGLVTYVCLRVAGWLSERVGATAVFPTEAPPQDWVIEDLNEYDEVVEVDLGLKTDARRGLVRLWLPGPMVERFVSAKHLGSPVDRLRKLVGSHWGELQQHWPVSLARLMLTVDECLGLDPGDILLPTEHGLETEAFGAGVPAALVEVRPPDSPFGVSHVLTGRVSPGPDRWQLTLDNVAPNARKVRPMDDATSEQAEDAPTAEQATELLEAPSVAVDVQVGTASLTLREISELTGGQVIELDRRVGEPLDLYVDGRRLGRGELVDIEGELGVRLLELDER